MKNTNLTQIDLEKIIKDITDLYNEYNPSDGIDFESLKKSFECHSDNYSDLKFDIPEPEEDTYVAEKLSDEEIEYRICRLSGNYCADEEPGWNEDDLAPTFSEFLCFFISRKHFEGSDVYKAAQVDRRLFSKIISNKHYTPTKDTVIRFIIALKLDMDDAYVLMESAGYTFSRSILRDVVIEYYIEKEKYDIDEINEVLYSLNLKLLTK